MTDALLPVLNVLNGVATGRYPSLDKPLFPGNCSINPALADALTAVLRRQKSLEEEVQRLNLQNSREFPATPQGSPASEVDLSEEQGIRKSNSSPGVTLDLQAQVAQLRHQLAKSERGRIDAAQTHATVVRALRSIAEVTTAVARGDLSKQVEVPADVSTIDSYRINAHYSGRDARA